MPAKKSLKAILEKLIKDLEKEKFQRDKQETQGVAIKKLKAALVHLSKLEG